jgi:hypothetical protein
VLEEVADARELARFVAGADADPDADRHRSRRGIGSTATVKPLGSRWTISVMRTDDPVREQPDGPLPDSRFPSRVQR